MPQGERSFSRSWCFRRSPPAVLYPPTDGTVITILRSREFLTPFEQTARLCGMVYLLPFVISGALRLREEEISEYSDLGGN
jgi:hypothetical protein